MAFDLKSAAEAAKATLQNPRSMARAIMQMNIPASTGWIALLLMVVVSALLTSVAVMIAPTDPDPQVQAEIQMLLGSPFKLALLQAVVMLVSLVLIHTVGRRFGGTGRFSDALVLLVWIEFLLIALQAVQIVALLVSAAFADMVGLAGAVLFMWLLSQFIAELHGFRSALIVFLGIIATIITASFVLALVMVGLFGMRV
jgi:hypothetical protein